ncbi:MAG: arginase [Pyrinomonadaceae bacterium]|nr:arginase [Pyrinomonadaceae bacterium]
MFDRDFPGLGKKIGLIGVPLGFGASKRGSALGTRTIRQANVRGKKLIEHISDLGFQVHDYEDLDLPRPIESSTENPKFLTEMNHSVEKIIPAVKNILENEELPVILGGDHSIALPTFSAIQSHFRSNNGEVGLIWFDAHADMNTPDTSPSGNLHGMPLAHLLGFGLSQFAELEGFTPKVNPKFLAHIGARDLDNGEKKLIRELGIHCWTMHEIDRYGMNYCIEKAIEVASQAPNGFAVTFDVDSLDPIDAPGSGTLVRGGISYREAHLALERISETDKMRSFEIVEVNPMLDRDNRTSELAVELILSVLGKKIL